MKGAIVILGNLSSASVPLEDLGAEFDWSLERVFDREGLARVTAGRIVPAVLFDPNALRMPWHQALALVRQAAPNSHPILCYRFSEFITWSELARAGAFHSLRLPLDLREVRQSFGFVWAATSSASKNLGSMPALSRIRALKALATDGNGASDQKFGERKGPQATRGASAG